MVEKPDRRTAVVPKYVAVKSRAILLAGEEIRLTGVPVLGFRQMRLSNGIYGRGGRSLLDNLLIIL